jgi:hypothetical protein
LGSILFKQLGERLSPTALTFAKGVVGTVFLGLAAIPSGYQPVEFSALIMLILSGVLGIAAALLGVKVVREIQRQQVESSKLIQTQPVFNAPPAPPQFGQSGDFGNPSSSIR